MISKISLLNVIFNVKNTCRSAIVIMKQHLYYLTHSTLNLTFHISSGNYYYYRRDSLVCLSFFRFIVFIHRSRRQQKYSYCTKKVRKIW